MIAWPVLSCNACNTSHLMGIVRTKRVYFRIPSGPLHIPNEYLISHLANPCICGMNIWSVIRLTLAYTNWIFSQWSAGPLHMPNEYLIRHPPNPCIHGINIQTAIHLTHSYTGLVICLTPAYTDWIVCQWSNGPLHMPNEYLIGHPPNPCIHGMNTQSTIHLTHSYTEWIFS